MEAKVEWAYTHAKEMEARAEYETKYTTERNYRMLMGIFQQAI